MAHQEKLALEPGAVYRERGTGMVLTIDHEVEQGITRYLRNDELASGCLPNHVLKAHLEARFDRAAASSQMEALACLLPGEPPC
jgi:hypothetical protein